MTRSRNRARFGVRCFRGIRIGRIARIAHWRIHGLRDRHIVRLRLDVSHFSNEKKIRAGIPTRLVRRAYADVFCEHSRVSPAVVRRHARLHITPYACLHCGNPGVHNGHPLTLHLDHVNGVHDDNRVENLRWLCPNCHSQTPTYCGRSSRRRRRP